MIQDPLESQSEFVVDQDGVVHGHIEQPVQKKASTRIESQSRKMIKIGLIVLAVMMGLMLILVILLSRMTRSRVEPPPIVIETFSVEYLTPEIGQFQKDLDELRVELRSADPTFKDDPFPPVDMNIRLE